MQSQSKPQEEFFEVNEDTWQNTSKIALKNKLVQIVEKNLAN